jgi:hypothetical protein
MLPVVVKDEAPRRRSNRPSPPAAAIEIEFARGVVRLQGEITPTLLRTLIEALARG